MTALPAVDVQGISKRYRRGAIGARSLREELEFIFARIKGSSNISSPRDFYALKDVTFSVPTGSVCGIIGRNGSGKTTLLKVLTSITIPESGQAILRGRVGSLLEVGAGFHPDLDGLENIYLNGAILGMSKVEIFRKLDQIIAFADIGPVLETPVKRYSSGMYIRLAFAIAAHLEPEILLVDEVLAVGDTEFQRKCLGKMKDVAGRGRTVLFVSHNMAMVRQLCNMALHLDHGVVQRIGDAPSVIDGYLASISRENIGTGRAGTDELWAELRIVEAGSQISRDQLKFAGDYDFILRLGARQTFHRCVAHVQIYDREGQLISTLESFVEGIEHFDITSTTELLFEVRSLGLVPGTYTAGIALYAWGEESPALANESVLSFDVVPATVNGAYWSYVRDHGIVRLAHSAKLLRV